jgi:hypothetical protein
MEKGMKNRMNHHSQIKVLMICHGNICRSPMAEFIFKDMVAREGLSDRFLIESAATSTEEIGNPVYLPARFASGITIPLIISSVPSSIIFATCGGLSPATQSIKSTACWIILPVPEISPTLGTAETSS